MISESFEITHISLRSFEKFQNPPEQFISNFPPKNKIASTYWFSTRLALNKGVNFGFIWGFYLHFVF